MGTQELKRDNLDQLCTSKLPRQTKRGGGLTARAHGPLAKYASQRSTRTALLTVGRQTHTWFAEVEAPAFGRVLCTLSGVIALCARSSSRRDNEINGCWDVAPTSHPPSTTPPPYFLAFFTWEGGRYKIFEPTGLQESFDLAEKPWPAGTGMGQQASRLLISSVFTFPWAKWRRLRGMPNPAALRSTDGCCCRCSRLLSLTLLLVLVLQPPGSRVDGAVAGEDAPSSSSRRFQDPRATLYDVLGVSQRSSQKEIKQVFKKLAIQMHPDKVGPFENEEAKSEANAIFIKVFVLSFVGCRSACV